MTILRNHTDIYTDHALLRTFANHRFGGLVCVWKRCRTPAFDPLAGAAGLPPWRTDEIEEFEERSHGTQLVVTNPLLSMRCLTFVMFHCQRVAVPSTGWCCRSWAVANDPTPLP